MESTYLLRTFPFRMIFFYLVEHGLDFDISLLLFHTYSYTDSKSSDQPGKVANPARDQLNRDNACFPVPIRA